MSTRGFPTANDRLITIIQDMSTTPSETIVDSYTCSFKASFAGMVFKKEKYSILANRMNELWKFSEFKHDGTRSNEVIYLVEETEQFFIIITSSGLDEYLLDAYAMSFELNHRLFHLIKDLCVLDTDVELYFNTISMGKSGITQRASLLAHKEVDMLDNRYYPYIKVDEMFEQYSSAQENIIVLLGEPGVGKSKLASSYMKYLVNTPELLGRRQSFNVAYVKSEDVLSLDQFWNETMNSDYDALILDDLDYFLTSRDTANTSEDLKKNIFLSNILSLTDGVKKSKMKIIITTNRPVDGIDKAIMRKGRMFDILELRKLKNSEARVIWQANDLGLPLFEETFGSSADILQSDLGSEIHKLLTHNKELTTAYILEDNISKLNSFKKTKKLGL